ncbi:MAG: hypothetical protein ACPH7H_07005, partial [Porticoccaceae bacterium]
PRRGFLGVPFDPNCRKKWEILTKNVFFQAESGKSKPFAKIISRICSVFDRSISCRIRGAIAEYIYSVFMYRF